MFRDFLLRFIGLAWVPYQESPNYRLVFAKISLRFLLRLYAMIGICLNISWHLSSATSLFQCFLSILDNPLTTGLYLVIKEPGE